ncbi:MAG: ATP-binding protein, partial [Micrococcales bacterium]|nr:ATP-binding protein [Micrococcales bacterium]
MTQTPYPRERYLAQLRPLYDSTDLVKVVTGVRRAGKSVLLRQVADELRARVGPERVVETNFELTQFDTVRTAATLVEHVTSHLLEDGRGYVILDEVGEVEQFERAVNDLRARGGVSVFISGSNAHLLSGELATYLAGRYVELRVWPLSYAESLALRGLGPSAELLTDYLTWGGMPQRFTLPAAAGRVYLRDVFASVVLRDVVTRAGIRDVPALETILDFAMENLGRTISPQSLTGYLAAHGRKVATDTIYAYLRALTGSLLLNRVRRYDVRGRQVMTTLDKYYATDAGLLAGKRVGAGPGVGDLIENAVYVELAARGFDLYTGKTRTGEIDFVAVKDGTPRYLQVAYLLATEDVADREFGAF